MTKRKMTFDNGYYCDGKKRIVAIVGRDGNLIAVQNPYKGRQKNNKVMR